MPNYVRSDQQPALRSQLGQSAEDYLEAVLVISRTGQRVRVTDIAVHLGVTKPSVSAALSGLEQRKLVRHERYGEVQLTAQGALVAEEMYRRHRLLHKFLRDVVGVPDRVAARDACRVEHVLSSQTLERLAELVESERGDQSGAGKAQKPKGD